MLRCNQFHLFALILPLFRNIFSTTPGVPVMFSTITVRVYPPESKTRSVSFVLPGHNIDRKKTEDILSTITGGRVIIHDIQPYNDDRLNDDGSNGDRGGGSGNDLNIHFGDDSKIKKDM